MPLHPLTALLSSSGVRGCGVRASGVGGCPGLCTVHGVCGIGWVPVPCPGWGTGMAEGQALDVFPYKPHIRWQLESGTCF